MGDCCHSEAEKPMEKPLLDPTTDPFVLYRPLIIIAVVSLVAGFLGVWSGHLPFMVTAMGQFFILVGVLKLFDVHGFAMTFKRYDLAAMHYPPYARVYPYIEVALGLFFLTGIWPVLTHLVTLVIMGIGIASVYQVIKSGKVVNCACIGTGFTLPVGRVTLLEYGVMAAMVALNLLVGVA